MKYLTTILKKIIPRELPKPVGRWNIEQCNNKVNHKVDLSNEDHCGPCGQYALTKLELTKLELTNENNDILVKNNCVLKKS